MMMMQTHAYSRRRKSVNPSVNEKQGTALFSLHLLFASAQNAKLAVCVTGLFAGFDDELTDQNVMNKV